MGASTGVPGSDPPGVAEDAGRCGPTTGEVYGGASPARRLRGAPRGEVICLPLPLSFCTRLCAGGGVISAGVQQPAIGPSVRKACVAGESGGGGSGCLGLPVEYRIEPCDGGSGGGGGGGDEGEGDGDLGGRGVTG